MCFLGRKSYWLHQLYNFWGSVGNETGGGGGRRKKLNVFSLAVELAPTTHGCSPSKICFPRMGNGPAACRMRLCPVSDGEQAVMYRRQEALRVPGGSGEGSQK